MNRAIAFDLGGTHCSMAIVEDRALLATREIRLEARKGLASVLPSLRAEAAALLDSCSVRERDCLGVSLSLPSLVDFASGRIVSANDKYPDAAELDLHGWCRDVFGLPLAVENDARAALLGESFCGAAEGVPDVLMLTLGTGIGSAVLAGGRPYRTKQAQGGNLGGHIPVAVNGRPCTCGAIGCMEAEASSWALPAIATEWPGIEKSALSRAPKIDFEALFGCAHAKDEVAQGIVAHCLRVWSVGLVGLVHAYGPELVVLGGGVMQNADAILPEITAYVHRHAWTPSGTVRIVRAQLGNHAPLHAAVPLLQAFLRGAPDGK